MIFNITVTFAITVFNGLTRIARIIIFIAIFANAVFGIDYRFVDVDADVDVVIVIVIESLSLIRLGCLTQFYLEVV